MRAHAIATQLVGSGNPLQIIRLALLAFHRDSTLLSTKSFLVTQSSSPMWGLGEGGGVSLYDEPIEHLHRRLCRQ